MKTNSLLLAGLVSLAGVVATEAQTTVYSVNSVGFVNVSVPSQKFTLIANPLIKGNNTLDEVFQNTPDGTTLYLFDRVAGAFVQHFFDTGVGGWFKLSGGVPQLVGTTTVFRPGEGGFIFAPNAFTATFSGEVAQGTASNVSFGEGFQILSSAVPMQQPVASLTAASSFNVATGDQVFKWNPNAGSSGAYSIYYYDSGLGWFELVGGVPAAVTATIDVGESFFYFGNIGSGTRSWNRNFSVAPTS